MLLENANLLHSIRINTEHDLTDAIALAKRCLPEAQSTMSKDTFSFSRALFIAVAMDTAYKGGDFEGMLRFLVDPRWDSPCQILAHFTHSHCAEVAFRQKQASLWLDDFINKRLQDLNEERVGMLVKRFHAHWKIALSLAVQPVVGNEMPPPGRLQIFNPKLAAKALSRLSKLRDDKVAVGERLIEDAQRDEGYRTVPDAKLAMQRLQVTKLKFENLAEPIERLQASLMLASYMKVENFRIAPMLLLGEPGIGKTYLATCIADILGVAMDKVSAGGAQGGFQLTGSSASWQGALPGSVFALFAEGHSASPVLVIDEVDKIRDSSYPVLPVLLDLLEPGTARAFKDEFFDMTFDASKLIVMMTANSIKDVPESLLSRCEVFDVPRPGAVQRLRIIHDIAKQLRQKTGTQIEVNESAASMIANAVDIDLRQLNLVVEDAFAKALQSGDNVAYLWMPKKINRVDEVERVEGENFQNKSNLIKILH